MKVHVFLLFVLFLPFKFVFGQQHDSTIAKPEQMSVTDSTTKEQPSVLRADSTQPFLKIDDKAVLQMPTMPPLRMSEKQSIMNFNVGTHKQFWQADDRVNFDALNMPTTRADYQIAREFVPPIVQLTPLNIPSKDEFMPLPFNDYSLPTRQELDVLEILWTKDDVMDTTIYSCLDPTLPITMADLNRLLDLMTRKEFVSRRIVSPRFEFNAFGVLIEMSPHNIRNRVYEYRSNMNEEIMKRFIDANAYLFTEDSSIVNMKQLRAARNDSTLLRDLNARIKLPAK